MKNCGKLPGNIFWFISLLLWLLVACKKKEYLFEAVPGSVTGIDFANELKTDSDLHIFNYLYYYNGAGVAAGDYNSDGLPDLYFVSNEGADRLYLNRGNFLFEDVTSAIGVINDDGWSTGVANVDINGDGLLDIYICKVSDYLNLTGHNLLLINQGNSANGIPIFKEESKHYGLDFSGFSTQAAFLDYDNDSDLDMYLLNHSVHPNRTYGRGVKRKEFNSKAGDRLYRNENGKYKDVSFEAGIFQGEIGYGLGVGVSDLNSDGYPDIYVGNDFFENDYLYINGQDGTFRDLISEEPQRLGHTSHFSMGNDIADINNDGLPDIISLDMLPQNLETYKASGLEYPYQTYSSYLKQGFAPQYMQNTLHINRGDLNFSESAFLSGIAATEWSWSPLLADFDNDGHKDLFVSNGIKGATNDMDFINFISNDKIQERLSRGESADHSDLIDILPEKKVANYIFRNQGDNTFKDKGGEWATFDPTFSQGAVYVDLDIDGDLDLVVNNMEDRAGIFRNLSERSGDKGNYLNVNFSGNRHNSLGIGAKVKIFSEAGLQVQEHYLSRGYQSSLAPGLHFGLANVREIDSVEVIWSDQQTETRYKVKANSRLIFDYTDAVAGKSKVSLQEAELLVTTDTLFGHRHKEQETLDFNRDRLIPFAYSNLGPGVSVADINGDGLDDLAIGGGKTQPLSLWIQRIDGSFEALEGSEVFEQNSISEDIQQQFMDIDSDGDLDLIVVSGGNEFREGTALQPKVYINENGSFRFAEERFEDVAFNASGVKSVDLNGDGFQDICFISNIVPTKYGAIPMQYLFLNDGKGNFRDVTENYSSSFQNAGNVQDVVWIDIDGNDFKDAIVVGHWMPVRIYLNNGQKLELLKTNLDHSNGWWNAVEAADFDKDGDVDFFAGNWGLNSKLKATEEKPLTLYLNDFDRNGSLDPVITYFYEGKETAFASKDELDQQMPFLKKKFRKYNDYARADFAEVFEKTQLARSEVRKVYELATCYFENLGNNTFKKHILPFDAQVSPVHAVHKYDFDQNGFQDLLLLGNTYEVSTQLGRLDASHGTLLLNDGVGYFNVYDQIPAIAGPVRDIKQINIKGEDYFVITINNAEPVFLKSNYKKL